ncbi:MAG: hypothetical protein SO360_01930 [Bifidobacterium tsurumiense]|uniref:hypothetical protein n=1 Tax=Bifidobacterium tsurumiense TaxID=356829 RepID=UPI002A80D5D6|nr:hypothetical protein [Bifidobacterium tsurumiense]MDY4677612.1 hypothetical protein [Bifidobacterium tsurumiense]
MNTEDIIAAIMLGVLAIFLIAIIVWLFFFDLRGFEKREEAEKKHSGARTYNFGYIAPAHANQIVRNADVIWVHDPNDISVLINLRDNKAIVTCKFSAEIGITELKEILGDDER